MQLYIDQLQVNYVNPLLYPVNVIDFPSLGRDVLSIFIDDHSALSLLTLSSARKPHPKKRPLIVNPITCKQKIHGGLLVILQSK